MFGLGSLRDLPNMEALEEAGLLERGSPDEHKSDELDEALGLDHGDDGDMDESAT